MPRLPAALVAALALTLVTLPAPGSTELPEICATVDGDPITRADVLKAFDTVILSKGGIPSAVKDEERSTGLRIIVEGIVNDRLMARAAKDVVVTDLEVEARFKEIRAKYETTPAGGQEAFRDSLAKTGMTESALRENLRASIRQGRWMSDQIEPKLSVTPQEIQKAYDGNKETFTNPPLVRASHILFQILPAAGEADIAAKKKKAEDVAARLVASKGTDFAKVAAEVSEDDVTKAKGGDLGWFAAGSAETEFEKAAFKIKVGDITAPIRTKIGYHLIQKTGERPAQLLPLDQALQERIKQLILVDKRKAALEKLIADLRAKAKVEIKLPN